MPNVTQLPSNRIQASWFLVSAINWAVFLFLMYVLFTQNQESGLNKYEVGKVTRRKVGRKDWPDKVWAV